MTQRPSEAICFDWVSQTTSASGFRQRTGVNQELSALESPMGIEYVIAKPSCWKQPLVPNGNQQTFAVMLRACDVELVCMIGQNFSDIKENF